MRPPAELFAKLLRPFGAEAMCSLCTDPKSCSWHVHCVSQQHWYRMIETTKQQREMAGENLCQTIEVIGGSLKYNHPQGEVHGMRSPTEQEENMLRPKELSVPCLLYTSPSPRDGLLSRMPSSA